MNVKVVDLKAEYPFLAGGKLECITGVYPFDLGDLKAWKRPAVVVVPGGGYGMVSKREGEPIAHAFLARGYQVFILTYLVQCDGVHYPEQLLELAAAVDYVKKNAEAFSVNPSEVFAVGFSAGGHLVGNLAVEHQNVAEKAGVNLDCSVAAVGLSYPVITSNHGHAGSYENLLSGYTDEAKAELCKTLNLDEAVSEHTPPAFIWATATDAVVPADNSLRFALALDRCGVQYELHVYPKGLHGLSTTSLEINHPQPEMEKAGAWLDACAKFFRMYTEEKY